MWQHVQLSDQIRPGDTLACCWDVKQPTNNSPTQWANEVHEAREHCDLRHARYGLPAMHCPISLSNPPPPPPPSPPPFPLLVPCTSPASLNNPRKLYASEYIFITMFATRALGDFHAAGTGGYSADRACTNLTE